MGAGLRRIVSSDVFFHGHPEQAVPQCYRNGKRRSAADRQFSYCCDLCRGEAGFCDSSPGRSMAVDSGSWPCQYRNWMLFVFFSLVKALSTDSRCMRISGTAFGCYFCSITAWRKNVSYSVCWCFMHYWWRDDRRTH